MRIAIDGMDILHGTRGIRRYAVELIRALMRIDQENDYVIFYQRFRRTPNPPLDVSAAPNFSQCILPLPGTIVQPLWRRGWLPVEKITGKIDLFHSLHELLPRRRKAPIALTIHSLIHLEAPDRMPGNLAENYNAFLARATRHCDYFICVSEALRRLFLETFEIPLERVRVVHLGVGKEFHPQPREHVMKKLQRRFGIKGPYLLYAGAANPWKNIDGIVSAFALLCRQSSFSHSLVLAGEGFHGAAELAGQIDGLGLSGRVLLTGRLDQHTGDLPLLYAGADCLLFPSYAEGFGLPPLEAMACGTPVIGSTASAVPEVMGDAGILVDPACTEEIADAVSRVLDDESLRENLVKKGLARAKLFTWERTARETLELYKEWSA